jgi:hypothetical protein
MNRLMWIIMVLTGIFLTIGCVVLAVYAVTNASSAEDECQGGYGMLPVLCEMCSDLPPKGFIWFMDKCGGCWMIQIEPHWWMWIPEVSR